MTRPSPLFLILTQLVVAIILILTPPLALAQPGEPAPSQVYFLSIDCGATTVYTDPISGIHWVPDGSYTSVGTNVAAVRGGTTTANNAEAQTLRYFKDPRKKFCYELPVQANLTYLIAASFWYGNYDGLNLPPVFNMAIDATEMLQIDLTVDVWTTSIKRMEYVRKVGLEQTSMSVCFYQAPESLTTPFVSSIELRQMDPIEYNLPWIDEGNFLLSFARQDFGGATSLRFPDDVYDRVWSPWPIPGTTAVTTTATISDHYLRKTPHAVMQTAITPTWSSGSNLVLSYAFGSATYPIPCVYYMYFAEISVTANATSREFSVDVPNNIGTPMNIYTLSEGINKALVESWTTSLTNTTTVTLSPKDPPTIDGPLVSGAELLAKFPELTKPTNADDAAALQTIKAALLLTGWSGDPCLPVPYDWITCSAVTSPRVLTVNLNGYNLTGQIPIAFAQLTSLTSLQLANNSLSGSIPDSLAKLPALTELILYNNNFTGTVPATLRRHGLTLDIRGNPVCNCTPFPTPFTPSSGPTGPKPKPLNAGAIAGMVGGILGVVFIGALLLRFCCFQKRNKAIASGSMQGAKAYSFAQLTSATQNFKEKLGEGGFGSVYYGKLGGREVAVKVLDANSRQGVREFNNEVQLLSRVHHRNLVSLVGYCAERKNQMLVYEFLHKGTVREHLYGSPLAHEEPLDWKMRLDIALNSAQGLEYLHGGCTPNIIHRDVKSCNILLTDKYVAKVADFGISKLGPETGEASHVSTQAVGTFGYLDPEYCSTNNLTEKSDVYSFGVVLLELLCGRKPIDKSLENESEWHISEKARNALQAGDIESMLDPVVKSCHPNMNSVWKVAEIAIQSVESRGVHRPFMRDVVRELREAIVLEAGHSHASFSSEQSSTLVNTARPAPRGQDSLHVSDASTNILEYTMPEGR